MAVEKNILVVARHKKTEALRMASGLTLLDDPVKVAVLGSLPVSDEVDLQLESLEFAEVPLVYLDGGDADGARLAEEVRAADVVYVV